MLLPLMKRILFCCTSPARFLRMWKEVGAYDTIVEKQALFFDKEEDV